MTDGQAPLMLSVSGMRGIVGQSITPERVARFAAAFGGWVRKHAAGADTTARTPGAAAAPTVVLGRDSRPSGEMFELAAAAGLVGVGCRVVRLGVATTPGVAIMVDHLGADAGLVVTASHNPIVWNGMKPLRHDGVAPPPAEALDIIAAFKGERGDLPYVDVHALHPVESSGDTPTVHAERTLAHIDVDLVRRAATRIVIDGVHGAGGPETIELLRRLHVTDDRLLHLYAEPTGRFPHPPEPTAENLAGLGERVRAFRGDVGFAQDPDADRLALVDENGRYIGEEYTLALCAHHVLKPGDVAVANLSTSRMLDDIAERRGATVVRTAVGEANVAQGMRDAGAVIGGEGNGGIILAKLAHVRDSLAGIALVLELLARSGKRLSELVAELPSYAIVKDKVPFDPTLLRGLEGVLRDAFGKDARYDTQDGVRVDWAPPAAAWVHVRPSNTEPIVRIIAEAGDEAAARKLVAATRAALGVK